MNESLEVLRSIYGEELKEDENGNYFIELKFERKENGSPLEFYFEFDDPENIKILCGWLDQKIIDKLESNLSRDASNGFEEFSGFIYECIEKIKTDVENYLNSNQQISNNEIEEITKEEVNKEEMKIENNFSEIKIENSKEYSIITGDVFEKKNSKFQAHLIHIDSTKDIVPVLMQLKSIKKYLQATHNIYAYR